MLSSCVGSELRNISVLAYKVFPYTCLKLTFSITSSCVPFKSYRLCVKWCDIIIISLYKLAEVLVSYPGSQLGEGEGEPSISCGGGLATRLAREGGGRLGNVRINITFKRISNYFFHQLCT